MSLFISTATASSELQDTPIQEAIKSFAMNLAQKKRQGHFPDGPSLDVTFMLPGQKVKPDFMGMRMGGYTKNSGTLYFEREVPEYIIHSDQAGYFVSVVMQDVVEYASEFFQEHEISFDDHQWQHALQRIM